MINFKPQKRVSYLPPGEYTASVSAIQYFEEKGYFALDFQVDDQTTFNTAFAVNNIVFNGFASDFVDENGFLDDTQMLDTFVEFTVKDKKTADETKSRVISLKTVYEEE